MYSTTVVYGYDKYCSILQVFIMIGCNMNNININGPELDNLYICNIFIFYYLHYTQL